MSRRLRFRLLVCSPLALIGLAASAPAQVTDPHVTSWQTARTYARVFETTADKTSGNAVATWPRSGLTNGGGGQATAVYADVQRVVYSNNYVYVYATGLASYQMGNWLTPNNMTYTSWPSNRAAIHRIPRTVNTSATTRQKTNGNGGLLLNGVFVWANGDAQSYATSTATVSMSGQGIWNRLAGVAEAFNFDAGKGHQPNSGAYHNHVNPIALRYQLGDNVSYNAATKTYAESATLTKHSPLIGWANDGLPIYGPYGYASPLSATSGIRRMTTGFARRDGQTTNRNTGLANTNLASTGRVSLPAWSASVQGKSATLASTEYGPTTTATYQVAPGVTGTYSIGMFAEDYDYLGDLGYVQGTDFDLNRQNIRYCVTPEYPSGTYAYFVCIDSAGTTVFPDIIGQEYYGAAAVGTGTVASITETVTDYARGGQASALSLAATAASPSGVVLAWPSVEGATYSLASSADGTTYTTLASSVTSAGGATTSYTTATVAAYYKVTLTAVATYDTTGNGGITGVGGSATASYTGTGANTAPTLTTVSTLSGATEDTAFTLSYATLAAAADEADAQGDAIAFRIEAVSSGTLTKNGSAVVAGTTTLAAGESLVWTPAANASGTLAAFTVRAYDGSLASASAITVNLVVTAVNDAPTLTTVSTLSGAVKNTAFTVAYATLAAAADESDPDGTTPSFRIEAVSSGTLTKSGSAVVAGTTTLASGESLVWTPATNATGTLAAFTVRAYDGALASASAVQVSITVTTTAVVSDAQLSSWYVARTGRYARIVETDAELLADSSKTTWTRTSGPNTISQSTPVYAGPQQVDYSASWVYMRTPSLATYTMGPWYDNAAKSALFVNVPKNQGFLVRFPRSASLGSIPSTKTATAGLNIGGVMQPAAGYYVDGVALFDPTDGFAYANGTESSPGTGQWHRDAYANEYITFDKSYAHQQNQGVYHNHANPIALRYQLGDNVTFNAATKTYAEGDTSAPGAHSPIIGWMIDGLPVYGPYGYSSALDAGSGVRRMIGGFVLRDGTTAGVDNIGTAGRTVPAWSLRNGGQSIAGPAVGTTYPLGRYIEDYAYLGDLIKTGTVKYAQGVDFDLNEYNVRYCVTPEFPNGTWAYFLNISSAGVPRFPYMLNRWFYGTPTGGTVTSIAETVTNQFSGGANRPLAITGATVATPNVTVSWNAVEGATYAVAASADGTTYTTKASGVTVSNANTKSQTYAVLGSTGTEYARVTRTALATYDTTGTVAATVAQTATTSYSLGTTNHAPTLDDVGDFNGQPEDNATTLSYATLAALCNETDADGDALSFRIESLGSGTLTKNGAAVTVGTLLSSGDSFVWTPPANGSGNFVPFTFSAYDGALASSPPVNFTIYVAAVNDAPTLGSVSTLNRSAETWPYEISYDSLAAAADEADVDNETLSFRIESVSSGTLTKNGSAVVPGTTTLSAGEVLVWTPATPASGTFPAFVVRAYDGALASATAATVSIGVSALVAPVVTESPGSDYVFNGAPYTFHVSATGSGPLAYQWYKNGASISGATAASYSIAAAMLGSHHGTYTVTVTNAAGYATSDPATLLVLDNSPYTAWTVEYFTLEELIAGTISTPAADSDNDGLPNQLEYAFGLHPSEADAGAPVTVSVVSNHLQITFPRLTDDVDLLYTVEVSSDLVTWTSGAAATSQVSATPIADTNRELVTVRDETALTTTSRRFIRIRVETD